MNKLSILLKWSTCNTCIYKLLHGCCGRDRMVVWFTTACAISAYHHWSCEFKPRSLRGVLDTTLCDKVCQWLVTGQWFSLGTPVSSTNETDSHDITEILLKVVLNTINQTKPACGRLDQESIIPSVGSNAALILSIRNINVCYWMFLNNAGD